jgi:hypothetical protein
VIWTPDHVLRDRSAWDRRAQEYARACGEIDQRGAEPRHDSLRDTPKMAEETPHEDQAVPVAESAMGQPRVVLQAVEDRIVARRASGATDVDDSGPLAYLSDVTLKGQDTPVRVTLVERIGSRVLLRQVDPGEPEPDRIPILDGDEIVVMEALSHTRLHTNPEPGSTDGFMFSYRIVPVRTEGHKVYVRTLRRDEADDGRRAHVPPGGQVIFEEGALVAELDHIDAQAEATQSGYVPLTPVLWTWLNLGTGHSEARTRYLLAAARRLDMANLLLIKIGRRTERLNQEGLAGPEIRRNLFELVGAVELTVIAVGRAVDMVMKARTQIVRDVPVPDAVANAQEAVKEIRDAYEHIDERAAGNVWRKPHPDALTIFDWRRLLVDGVITYGPHEIELTEQLPALLSAIRRFFKDAAADGQLTAAVSRESSNLAKCALRRASAAPGTFGGFAAAESRRSVWA